MGERLRSTPHSLTQRSHTAAPPTRARAHTGAVQMSGMHDQQEPTVAVLLVDEGGCGMGADRVPRGASLSS